MKKIPHGDLITAFLCDILDAPIEWINKVEEQLKRIKNKESYIDWKNKQPKKPCCGKDLKEVKDKAISELKDKNVKDAIK